MFSTPSLIPIMNIADSRHFSPLVKDYLIASESSPIRDFFELPPFERSDKLRKLASRIVSHAANQDAQNNRQILVDMLRRQHESFGILTSAVQKNLDLLANPATLAVVTGQQTGILGGPLYTFYKAISAIALSRELQRVLGSGVVPVFWQETEDHDFDEATSCGILDKENTFASLKYKVESDVKRKQVGALPLDARSLEALWQQLRSSLQQTEFTDAVFELFQRCYAPQATFAEAQAKLLGYLAGDDGLLILNANTKALKSIAYGLFEKETATSPDLQRIIQSQTAKLAASYHAQLEPSPVNLFILDGGKRYKLEKEGNGFRYDEKFIDANELHRIIRAEPERLSPNVVLRPLYQDTLLPTLAYIAGPGEIAYYAQLKDAYLWAGIPMPLISPRFSATLVEDRVAKVLEKNGTNAEAMLEDGSALIEKLTLTNEEAIIGSSFDKAVKHIEGELEALRPVALRADATLDAALTTLKGKLLTPLKDFASKTLAAERRKSATLRSQLDRSLTSLLPDGAMQERQLGLMYYVNKYGLDFAAKLKAWILSSTSSPEHHILDISRIASGELPPKDSR